MNDQLIVEIVQQPPLVDRFRYKSEERPPSKGGPVDRKTYPAIRLLNYTGVATVVVSCVSTTQPYRQHPNVLVGDNCCKGVCKIEFETNKSKPTLVTFTNTTIRCNRKDEIRNVLEEREKLNIDPFKAGFPHKCETVFEAAVRLCFQVLLRSSEPGPNGRYKYVPIPPVVSNIVRSKIDLTLIDISDKTSPSAGKKTIMIFCNRVAKEDIKVRFYRENENHMVEWEAWGESIKVHRQVAIAFKTPAYATNDIQAPVEVRVQLVRPSDGKRSERPVLFQYLPDMSSIGNSARKKHRGLTESEALFEYVQQLEEQKRNRPKMEFNIPIMPPNQHFSEYAAAIPPTTPSNVIPNVSHHDGKPLDNPTAQSYPHQQTHFDSRNLQNRNIQNGVQCGHFAQLYTERSQIIFSQAQPPNTQLSTVGNGFNPVHSHFQPPHIYSDFQTANNPQLPTRNSNALKPLPDSKQQLQQSAFNYTSSKNECDCKNLASSYNPLQSYYNNAEQVYDPTTWNVHQFAANNNATMVHHGQNLCEHNFNADDVTVYTDI